MDRKQIAAVDLGASGGRVMCGEYDGERLAVKEIRRFANEPVFFNGTMYWDILRLLHEIKTGLAAAGAQGAVDSVSVDTWGVDFGLLDRNGRLMENPVHYRDKRTKGMISEVLKKIPGEYLYRLTGNQLMEINTVFQLYSLVKERPEFLSRAHRLLMMPDLILYALSGIQCSERSIASTSQLLDAATGQWSGELLEGLGIPQKLFCPVIPTGTRLGGLREDIQRELGMGSTEVIASAGHDTQAAMAAVPAKEKDFIFISCGTWALVGTELAKPLITGRSMECNVTNEWGLGERVSFLRNLTGTWLIQESRRQWKREGREYTFGQLEELAEKENGFQTFIDPDASEFVAAGNMPGRIREAAERKGQPVPDSPGAVVRCINESLAFQYRMAVEDIRRCTGKTYGGIYLIGGGSQSKMLCQMTANACKLPVTAGPIEATAAGNMGIQLMALGELGDMGQLRDMIRSSFPLTVYEPEDTERWEEQYQRYKRLYGGENHED